MKPRRWKTSIWRVITTTALISLVLLSVVSSNGYAQSADKGGKRNHGVVISPVEPPQIKTHPLHPNRGKGNQRIFGSTLDATVTPGSAPDVTIEPLATAVAADQVNSPRNMKVLVISPIAEQYYPDENYDTRYRLQAIEAFLQQIGLPYDVYVANSGGVHNPLPALWDGMGLGYYQGIILEVGNQWVYSGSSTYTQFLTTDEWNALWSYEVMFGVRELVMYLAPSPYNAETYGLTYTGEKYLSSSAPATLTDAGKLIYPYINAASPVPFINTYFYTSTLEAGDPNPATPLLLMDGSPVVSTHTASDGHQTLAITADYTGYLISSLVLSYGSINWLTQGVFLGERHTYLAPQVDDLLIDDNLWDPTTMSDTNDDLTYRMSGSDLLGIQSWQNSNFGNISNNCVTITLGPSAQDTYLDRNNPNNNYGNNGNLYTGAANLRTANLRSLIKFDLSSIPQGATITSADFYIYLSSSSGSADTVKIYPMSQAWVEGSGNIKRQPSGATWVTYNGKNMWKSLGGDYSSTLAGSFVAGTKGWKQVSLTTLVQSWLNTPSSNLGIILLSPAASNSTNNKKTYSSSDNTNQSLRPYLHVCYSATTSTTMKLEFGFNGEGASGKYNPDTLTPAVIANQGSFRWVNHTYDHVNLDQISSADTTSELTTNDIIALNQLMLTNYSREPFIQPDISGLSNADFQSAAYAFGVRYLISDTSQTGWNNPSPNVGIDSTLQPGLLIIPRHPTNLFYNLVTPDQWVSEYNCYYGPVAYSQCANGQWNYWPRDLTYSEILDKESDMILQYLLKWDIDPLMFHQANLGLYDGTNSLLTQLIDATLTKYNSLINLPIRNLSQTEIGSKMAERMIYNNSGVMGTYTPCSSITLTVANSAKIPVTGVAYGGEQESYGGQNISYVTVDPGTTISIPVTCPAQ